MASTPSAFFGQFSSGAELSHVLASLPSGLDFLDRQFDSRNDTNDVLVPPAAADQDDVFLIQPGDTASGGDGYDVVVMMPDASGHVAGFALGPSTEAGILTGIDDVGIRGNSLDNLLIGNVGDNSLAGGGGADVLIGGAGNDSIAGGIGDDQLFGGAGDDFLQGGPGNDQLFGGAGDDVLMGGVDNSLLAGQAGDDRLFGGPGNDTILGGPGNDTIFGGQGLDTLAGGPGRDVFLFNRGQEGGMDVITDFQKGQDIIDLSDFHTSLELLHFQDQGSGVIVTVGKGAAAVKFKLIGFHVKNIDGSFFLF